MEMRATGLPHTAPGWPPGAAWRARWVCAGLFLATVAYSFQFVSFNHAKEIALAAALLPLACTADRAATRRGLRAFLPLLLGLALCAALSLPRAHVAPLAVEAFGRAALPLLFVVLTWDVYAEGRSRAQVLLALQAAAVAVALLGVLQYAGWIGAILPAFPGYTQPIYSVFGNQDLLGGYLAPALPLLFWTATRATGPARLAATIGVFPVAAALVLSGSRSAWLAALTGVAVLAIAAHADGGADRARWSRVALAAAAGLLLAAAWSWPHPARRVAETFGGNDVGGPARLWFWDGALRMWADAPVLGHGLGQFPYWSPRYQGEALAAPGGESHYRNTLHTTDAHSEPLEWLAETGVLGVLFGLWMLARLARRRDPAIMAALAALLVFACLNSAFRHLPHALAGCVLAACLLADRPGASGARRGHFPIGAIAAVLALAALRAHTVWIPSALLATAEDRHLSGRDAGAAYARLHTWPWPCAAGHEAHAMLLLEQGDAARALDQARLALDGLDTGRAHRLLGDAAAAAGDRETACTAYLEALFRWPADHATLSRTLMACPEHRAALEAHAARWGLEAATAPPPGTTGRPASP